MESDWLINLMVTQPLPHVVHSMAWNSETVDHRGGALTFFLLQALSALRSSGVEVTHQSRMRISTMFHVHWPRQTPMRQH